jgi:hypothetical protein
MAVPDRIPQVSEEVIVLMISSRRLLCRFFFNQRRLSDSALAVTAASSSSLYIQHDFNDVKYGSTCSMRCRCGSSLLLLVVLFKYSRHLNNHY